MGGLRAGVVVVVGVCVCVCLVLGLVSVDARKLPPIPHTHKSPHHPPTPTHTRARSELLDSKKKTLVLCHHGGRSMQVASFLASQAGFEVRVYLASCSVAFM